MIYHVYANRSNIGDWLSAKGIQKLLSPLEIKDCFCDSYFLEETIECLTAATPQDFIIIGGGGLFMDYFTPFWKAFEPIADRVPFCIWGIGCCDLKNEPSLPPNNLIGRIVNKSKICVVRDQLTRSYLRNCKIADPIPCPAINYFDSTVPEGRTVLFAFHKDNIEAGVNELMRFTARSFAEKKGVEYRETNNRIPHNNEEQMSQILALYESSTYVLSSTLHGCIIAFALGKKLIAVSGDRKIEGFMKLVGLQEWVLDLNEAHFISERLNEIESQVQPSDALKKIRKENQEIGEAIQTMMNRKLVLNQ